jgi:transcriptional regulator with XRE-family HTH domain
MAKARKRKVSKTAVLEKGSFATHSVVRARGEFDANDYKYRLRLLREALSGENQQEFAERVGVPFKRWNTYERGYPIPRETAFLLIKQFDGISVEWLWFGMAGNMSPVILKRIAAIEDLHREREASAQDLKRAQAKVREVEARIRKASSSLPEGGGPS